MKITSSHTSDLHLKKLPQMLSFLVLRLPHIYIGSHPNRGLKNHTLAAKNGDALLKVYTFQAEFPR